MFAAFRRFPSASRLALQLAGHVVDAHVVHLSPADAAALVRVGLRLVALYRDHHLGRAVLTEVRTLLLLGLHSDN